MNILHLIPDLNLTCGISKTIYLIAKNSSSQFQHSVLTLGGDATEKFRRIGITVHVLPFAKSFRLPALPIIVSRVQKYSTEHHIDVLHAHHRLTDLIAASVKGGHQVKAVTSVQSFVRGKFALSYKAPLLIACSNGVRKHLIEYFHVAAERISVINNFVDPSEMNEEQSASVLRTQMKIEDGKIIIAYIGRIDFKEKGVDVLLQAFRKVHEKNIATVLLLVGKGKDAARVYKFLESHALPFLHTGAVENAYDYMKISNVIILPSRIDPFPLTVLEAGASAKPVIGSNVDGIAEMITDGVDGVLFEKENADQLAESMLSLLSNPERAARIANALRKKVESEFTAGNIIPLYEDVYRELEPSE